jgi:hypothetical protein
MTRSTIAGWHGGLQRAGAVEAPQFNPYNRYPIMHSRQALHLILLGSLLSCASDGSDALGPEELSFTVTDHLRGTQDQLGAGAASSVVGIGVGGTLAGSLCTHTVVPAGRVAGSSLSLTVEVRPRSDSPVCPAGQFVINYTALFDELTLGQTYSVEVTHVQQPGNEVTVPFSGPVTAGE